MKNNKKEKRKKIYTKTNRFNKQKRYVIFFLVLFIAISCKQRSLNSWCRKGCNGREGWAITQRFDGQTFFFYAPKCRHQLQDAGGSAHTPGLRLGSRRLRLINRPTFPIEPIHRGRPEKLHSLEYFALFPFRSIFSPSLFGSTLNLEV